MIFFDKYPFLNNIYNKAMKKQTSKTKGSQRDQNILINNM